MQHLDEPIDIALPIVPHSFRVNDRNPFVASNCRRFRSHDRNSFPNKGFDQRDNTVRRRNLCVRRRGDLARKQSSLLRDAHFIVIGILALRPNLNTKWSNFACESEASSRAITAATDGLAKWFVRIFPIGVRRRPLTNICSS